jgi:uncharacterized SAM-binding protein YcdF (DUF218 family)
MTEHQKAAPVAQASSNPRALCVLGCRTGSVALARRAQLAREVFSKSPRNFACVVACGGLSWGGVVEADAIARMLQEGDVSEGVPDELILRERRSRDTHENAIYAARILRERNIRRVVLVSCSWHVPRAKRLFERAGLDVERIEGAPPPNAGILQQSYWAARERVAYVKDLLRMERV